MVLVERWLVNVFSVFDILDSRYPFSMDDVHALMHSLVT